MDQITNQDFLNKNIRLKKKYLVKNFILKRANKNILFKRIIFRLKIMIKLMNFCKFRAYTLIYKII